MNLQPELEKAVIAEVAYSRAFALEQVQRPVAELRKEGLCLEPAKINAISDTLHGTIVAFQTSFVINTSWFRKGAKIRMKNGDKTTDGQIYELDAYQLTAFFPEDVELSLGDSVRIDFIPDDRTLRCLELGVQFLQTKPEIQELETLLLKPGSDHQPVEHPELNISQQRALAGILSEDRVTVIQGPPGTGKTHTLAVAIEALLKQGKRVLVSAPSNTAVDNLTRALIAKKIAPVRVGNEEKIHEAVLPFYLDELVEKSSYGRSIDVMQQQIRKLDQLANRHIRNYTAEAAQEKREARKELRELKRAVKSESKNVEQLILEKGQVVCGTPVGIFNTLSKTAHFDVLIIDEAGQCLSPLVWLIAVFANKLVLCGDPQQLPPTILASEAQKLGLEKSLPEASFHTHPPVLLSEQYRMADPISGLISELFYSNELINKSGRQPGELLLIDTAGYDAPEAEDEQSGSFSNPGEVELLKKIIAEQQFQPADTVIITPYNGQIALLKQTFKEWRISTIDAIQGQEETNILISLVRSNEQGTIGFLSDYRRTNVAISRAKQACYLIGDSATLGQDNFYNTLFQWIETRGNYRSAWEFAE